MADNSTDFIRSQGLPGDSSPRRAHSHSRLTTAVAVLALATAVYSLLRLDSTRDKLDTVRDTARTLEADRSVLRNEVATLTTRERELSASLEKRLGTVDEMTKQLQEFDASLEEVRGRTEGPQRTWARAEALFLLELAQRRLTFDRDVATSIVALESADTRLASLRDSSFAGVRQEIVRELQQLRAVRQPDTTGMLVRLASAEEQALGARVKGIRAERPQASDRSALPTGILDRAWTLTKRTLGDLIVVRKVDRKAGATVTAEEELIQRQHLQLLLLSARTALVRHDASSYRAALAGARQWLGESFDLADPTASRLLDEVRALEPVDIDPPLPDVSASSRTLRTMIGAARGPE
jgi:uroporphyrin-3 C-methyltransferase